MTGVFPVLITGDSLAVREVDTADLSTVCELGEYVTWADLGPEEWIADAIATADLVPRVRYSLAVDRGAVTVALTSLVVEPEESRAELGYAVVPGHRREGIATETVGLVCRFAFDVLGLRRVFALTAVDNVGSVAVLERCGFQREGRLRAHDATGVDSYIYGRLADDT